MPALEFRHLALSVGLEQLFGKWFDFLPSWSLGSGDRLMEWSDMTLQDSVWMELRKGAGDGIGGRIFGRLRRLERDCFRIFAYVCVPAGASVLHIRVGFWSISGSRLLVTLRQHVNKSKTT